MLIYKVYFLMPKIVMENFLNNLTTPSCTPNKLEPQRNQIKCKIIKNNFKKMSWSTPWRMENFCFFSFRHGVLHQMGLKEIVEQGGRYCVPYRMYSTYLGYNFNIEYMSWCNFLPYKTYGLKPYIFRIWENVWELKQKIIISTTQDSMIFLRGY